MELGPALAYEDVPISRCFYPFLKFENGALITRGTGQQRDDVRWGLSAAWDRQTPHYMLPARMVIAAPPKGLYVTAAQPFDFIYDTKELIERLQGDPDAKAGMTGGIL